MTGKKKSRLERADWLDIGSSLLVSSGAEGLRLERLCEAAGRTRGSFYHHFEDIRTFVVALLERWQERHTEEIIRQVQAVDGGARRHRLHFLATGLDLDLEVAVRRLAAGDTDARKRVEVVDKRRMDFLAHLIQRERGLEEATARSLAEFEYAVFVGLQFLFPATQSERLAAFGQHLDLLLQSCECER